MAKQKNEKMEVTNVTPIDVVNTADLDKLEAFDKRIESAIRANESAMMSIMGALAVIHEKKLYIAGGYTSVKDYYYNRHGMEIKKTALSEAVNTFRRFGDMETGLLKDEWTSYTYSQLKIMQRLTDEELEKVDVTTSCRAIQQIINDRNAIEEKPEESAKTEESEKNVSRETSVETKVETSGEVEPYVQWTYSIDEFKELDGEILKILILEQFEQGNKVILNYK